MPDWSKIDSKHNIFKLKTVPIMINLSQLLSDHSDTKLYGVELIKSNKNMSDVQFNKRRKLLSVKEVREYMDKSPKELWKNYDNPTRKVICS